MRNNNIGLIISIILVIGILAVLTVLGVQLFNLIYNSDLPLWVKWLLLK